VELLDNVAVSKVEVKWSIRNLSTCIWNYVVGRSVTSPQFEHDICKATDSSGNTNEVSRTVTYNQPILHNNLHNSSDKWSDIHNYSISVSGTASDNVAVAKWS
jgi:hypothetical protein